MPGNHPKNDWSPLSHKRPLQVLTEPKNDRLSIDETNLIQLKSIELRLHQIPNEPNRDKTLSCDQKMKNALPSPNISSSRKIHSSLNSFSPEKNVSVPLNSTMPNLTKTQIDQQLQRT